MKKGWSVSSLQSAGRGDGSSYASRASSREASGGDEHEQGRGREPGEQSTEHPGREGV
jgi:hypothetical protein